MISRDSLYSWLQTLIESAEDGSPLENAILFRSLRGSVDSPKVIRVECWSGRWTLTEEESREERDVDFVIQCVVTPEPETTGVTELEQMDTAKDLSFEMARTIYREMAPTGVAGVCMAYGDEWEQGEPNFGAANRGATYFYGKVNQ